ncbi:hypothetical protein [Mesonia maritima]|uniref:Uncharacterized protein YcfL n=1 Tax=Mesonia maritima TaxID=1793873 RepID=A0ABU1K8U6_9FLAO|nr:hypothetical protein [Mesonia maritima]MDR6302029.1 uncharacterized protein YcfL [Mesonia maritima]
MKKVVLSLFSLSLLIASCSSEEKTDPFAITNTNVGLLTKEVQVRKLDSVFVNDSIVKTSGQEGFNAGSEIYIFDKKGKEMLLLDPVQSFDSTSTIANIQVKDPRFKTAKGLNSESTFKDITQNYKISRIENTLRTAVIFIDEINAYVTIDKENISGDARYNTDVKIEPSQIPDDAKIKHFWIGWK